MRVSIRIQSPRRHSTVVQPRPTARWETCERGMEERLLSHHSSLAGILICIPAYLQLFKFLVEEYIKEGWDWEVADIVCFTL